MRNDSPFDEQRTSSLIPAMWSLLNDCEDRYAWVETFDQEQQIEELMNLLESNLRTLATFSFAVCDENEFFCPNDETIDEMLDLLQLWGERLDDICGRRSRRREQD